MSRHPKGKPKIQLKDIGSNDTIVKSKKIPTTKKRSRLITSSPESTPPKKIPSITTTTTAMNNDTPLTIDAIRSLLDAQTNSLQNSIQNQMKALGDELKSEFQANIAQLHTKIDSNQANVQQQINELKANVTQCMEQSNDTDDDIQRSIKLCELKLNGIAYSSEEKLMDIFIEIAKLVKFDLSKVNNMPTLTRIHKRNHTSNTSSPTPIVIVKFVANHIRNDFYRLYLNKIAAKQPIMSENIGLKSGSRIIIGENLTAKNYGVFVEAGKQKKQGKLCQVFTQDGLVHVKAEKKAKAKPIRSIRELELFINANPTSSNQMDIEDVSSAKNNNNVANASTMITPQQAMQLMEDQRQKQLNDQQQHNLRISNDNKNK